MANKPDKQETSLNEERIRQIVREELAKAIKSNQPTVVHFSPERQFVNVDALLERIQNSMFKS